MSQGDQVILAAEDGRFIFGENCYTIAANSSANPKMENMDGLTNRRCKPG